MDRPIRAQRLEQPRGEQRVTVLPPLPLLDTDRHPRGVDVADLQMQDFAEPEARRIGRQQHRAIRLIAGLGDQPLDLVTTQQRGQCPRLSRGRNTERGAFALQRRVIQKPQAVDDDVARTPRSLPIPNQMQHVRLDLVIGDAIRRPVIELRQPRDGPQIGLSGPVGHAAHDHGLVHPTA